MLGEIIGPAMRGRPSPAICGAGADVPPACGPVGAPREFSPTGTPPDDSPGTGSGTCPGPSLYPAGAPTPKDPPDETNPPPSCGGNCNPGCLTCPRSITVGVPRIPLTV